MANRVYLHVGSHKTGTSYLQNMLWLNRETLLEDGVALPLGKRSHHYDVVADLRGGVHTRPDPPRTWADFVRSTRSTPVSVLSEELLCASPTDVVERVVSTLAPSDVHVIYAARDVGRQVPAQWQQVLRARAGIPYDEFVQRLREDSDATFWQLQDPLLNVARWCPPIPVENFHLLLVPPAGSPPELLWERFASIIGISPGLALRPPRSSNESLGLVESEVLRRFNAQLGDGEFALREPYLDHVRRWLTVPALMGASTERIGIPSMHEAWLRDRSAQMVDDVRRLRSRVDVVGDPEDLRMKEVALGRAPAEIPEAELLERTLRAVADQLVAVRSREVELQSEVQRTRRELRDERRGRRNADVPEAQGRITASAWWRRLRRRR